MPMIEVGGFEVMPKKKAKVCSYEPEGYDGGHADDMMVEQEVLLQNEAALAVAPLVVEEEGEGDAAAYPDPLMQGQAGDIPMLVPGHLQVPVPNGEPLCNEGKPTAVKYSATTRSSSVKGLFVFHIHCGQADPSKAVELMRMVQSRYQYTEDRLRDNGYETLWLPTRSDTKTEFFATP